MVITFLLPGMARNRPVGGFRVIYEYANHLSQRGHRVNVVHPVLRSPNRANLRNRLAAPAVLVVNRLTGLPKMGWVEMHPGVNMLLVRSLDESFIPDGDAIVASAWQTAERVVDYSSEKGRKFYLVMDFDPWLGPKDRLEATWRAPLHKIPISGWLSQKVIASGAEDVTPVPIGVDHQRFRLSNGFSSRARKVAMLYSRLDYKASDTGLHALEICKGQHPELEAILFGRRDGPRHIPSWITYRSNASDETLVEIYNRCAIYLCSSLAEGFALPPAEAMACGCTVVSTDCGGIREYAEHEITALLSAPEDVEALASNLARLLEDEDLRLRLAKAGHERIQKFTWDKATDKFEEIVSGRNVNP
jgi:glycosyltransferase involved in cell wall biosynthesis